MTKKKLYLIIQAVLCVLLVILLCASALAIFAEGSARKAENPLESVYTPENVSARLVWLVPLLLIGLAIAIVGLILGIRDEKADKPVRDPSLNRDRLAPRMSGKKQGILQTVLLFAAVILILLGVLNGGLLDVLTKAINICTECVGLG